MSRLVLNLDRVQPDVQKPVSSNGHRDPKSARCLLVDRLEHSSDAQVILQLHRDRLIGQSLEHGKDKLPKSSDYVQLNSAQ